MVAGALFMNSMPRERSSSSSRRGGSISHVSGTCDGAGEGEVSPQKIARIKQMHQRKDALKKFAMDEIYRHHQPAYEAGQHDAVCFASFCAIVVCIISWFFIGSLLLSGFLAAIAGYIAHDPPFLPRYFFAYDDCTRMWTAQNLETRQNTHQFFYNNNNEIVMEPI